jgi:hypothetical protein
MKVQPQADGRYDVNDCLDNYDDWESYYGQHGATVFVKEWAMDLLVSLVDAVRNGTP